MDDMTAVSVNPFHLFSCEGGQYRGKRQHCGAGFSLRRRLVILQSRKGAWTRSRRLSSMGRQIRTDEVDYAAMARRTAGRNGLRALVSVTVSP